MDVSGHHSELCDLFCSCFGDLPEQLIPLKAHASKRLYFRMRLKRQTCIGVINENASENRTFAAFSKHFSSFHLPVPQIYALSESGYCLLEEDLGDLTLYDVLDQSRSKENGFPPVIYQLYLDIVTILPRFQIEAGRSLLLPEDLSAPYSAEKFLWDMRYFQKSFLDIIQVPYDHDRLQDSFTLLAEFLAQVESDFFLYRDFQSRNIMIKNNTPYFIDYQSGRKGPLQYDVASLLYQAQARIPEEIRKEILHEYLSCAARYHPINQDEFKASFSAFVLIRLMQVLGTYGEHGIKGRKQYFLNGIPYATKSIDEVLQTHGMPVDAPELCMVFEKLQKL